MKEEKNNNNKMLLQGPEGNCGRGQNVYKAAVLELNWRAMLGSYVFIGENDNIFQIYLRELMGT